MKDSLEWLQWAEQISSFAAGSGVASAVLGEDCDVKPWIGLDTSCLD